MNFNKNNYKTGSINKNMLYRIDCKHTSIIGVDTTNNNIIVTSFVTINVCKKEFRRLTMKRVGRPKERKRELTNKHTIV